MAIQEILVSIDGEFTGRIPGPYSMISLGAIAYNQDENEISRFKVNIHELPGATRSVTTMEWWKHHQDAWEAATKDPVDPDEGMKRFAEWLHALPGIPKLLGWPLTVDFMFIYWYYVKFVDEDPPFGYDGIDIQSYAMARLGFSTISEVSRKDVIKRLCIPAVDFLHDSLDDAAQQAKLFFALRQKDA